MKVVMRSKAATSEPLEKRFNRFAKALMAVPKKEIDKELTKDERKKKSGQKQPRRTSKML